MEKNRLIQLIENGRQVGVNRIIECENTNIAYTYAIQKRHGKYIVYIDEYDLDNCYVYEDNPTEKIFIYDSFEDFLKDGNSGTIAYCDSDYVIELSFTGDFEKFSDLSIDS